eukprot:6628336-Pyramimonas_sp.AAC.1
MMLFVCAESTAWPSKACRGPGARGEARLRWHADRCSRRRPWRLERRRGGPCPPSCVCMRASVVRLPPDPPLPEQALPSSIGNGLAAL